MDPTILILGASVRAAAASAFRAGLVPYGVDLFADRDLQMLGPSERITHYPADFAIHRYRRNFRGPFLFTGGLENHDAVLETVRATYPLWGNLGADVRHPQALSRCFQEHGIHCPRVSRIPIRDKTSWLLKPLGSSAGHGIREYVQRSFDPITHYLQEFIAGLPCSAVFVGRNDGTSLLLGVTQQLVSVDFGAPAFHYIGSVGPLSFASTTHRAWQRIGDALAKRFGLRGLFGVDAIERDSIPWPIEVNPRYTASVEILERAFGWRAIEEHRRVFEHREAVPVEIPNSTCIWGKRIVFARKSLVFPAEGPWLETLAGPPADLQASYADIPAVGERIEAGQPILTVFASAPGISACLDRLQEIISALALILDRA